VQHACGIANATGVHRHIDDLLLDRRRLTGVGILQEKGPSTPLKARPAPIALFAFRRQSMSHDIGPVTVWTMQHLSNHSPPPTKLVALVLNRGYQINSFETPSTRYSPQAVSFTILTVCCMVLQGLDKSTAPT
jgi:hypothetical protein